MKTTHCVDFLLSVTAVLVRLLYTSDVRGCAAFAYIPRTKFRCQTAIAARAIDTTTETKKIVGTRLLDCDISNVSMNFISSSENESEEDGRQTETEKVGFYQLKMQTQRTQRRGLELEILFTVFC